MIIIILENSSPITKIENETKKLLSYSEVTQNTYPSPTKTHLMLLIAVILYGACP